MSDCHSLYVQIPFCRAKCAYCDFNSYAGQESLIPAYVDALLREASLWSKAGRVGRVETLYFGGGTPSLLPVDEMKRLMDGLRRRLNLADAAEVSMEANPESVDLPRLQALRDLGVNRLSLGVQSFDDGELRFLGRIHDAARAEEAYRDARRAGFDSVSLDLIFGLPGQSLARWQRTLEKAVALSPDHLSLYALTIEEETPLARRVERGECAEPDADVQADMYGWSSDCAAAAGYEQYEISNWARSGHRCRHNLTYWRCAPYLGLGAGAHSYLGGYRFANHKQPKKYVKAVLGHKGALPSATPLWVESSEEPDQARELSDAVILGLRLTEGVALEAMRDRFGVDLRERYGDEIAELEALGLLESVGGRIRLTARGRLLGNEAFQRFLA